MPQAIDVFEKYQGAINWQQVATDGIAAVWIKATNGNQKASPAADHYFAGATAAKLAVGLYAYVTGVAGAVADANILAAEIVRLGAYGLAPMCDFEDSTLPATAAARRTYVVSFFTQLHAKAPRLANAFLYLAGGSMHSLLDGWWPAGSSHMVLGSLTVYLIDAEYGVNNGVEHPRTHYTGPVGAHQYTSVGTLAGISSKVDRDNLSMIIPATGGDDVVQQLPPVKMSDGQMYNMTDVDVLTGLAQYIGGNSAPGAGQTAHPTGQYVGRILSLADIDTNAETAVGALAKVQAQITALGTVVAAGFKADADADAQQSAALANLTTGLTNTQTAVINAVVALPGQIAAGETDAPAGGGSAVSLSEEQLGDLAGKIVALLGPADAQAFSSLLTGMTLRPEFGTSTPSQAAGVTSAGDAVNPPQGG